MRRVTTSGPATCRMGATFRWRDGLRSSAEQARRPQTAAPSSFSDETGVWAQPLPAAPRQATTPAGCSQRPPTRRSPATRFGASRAPRPRTRRFRTTLHARGAAHAGLALLVVDFCSRFASLRRAWEWREPVRGGQPSRALEPGCWAPECVHDVRRAQRRAELQPAHRLRRSDDLLRAHQPRGSLPTRADEQAEWIAPGH